MPVLFAVLKVAAILLFIVAALLVAAMFVPLGFAIEYRPGRVQVWAVYGPLRRTVWSRQARPKPARKSNTQAPSDTPPAAHETPPATPPPPSPKTTDTQESKTLPPEPVVQHTVPGTVPPKPTEEKEEASSGAVMGRLERILDLMTENPRALASCVLGHMRWLQRHSRFKIHIRHLNVFWTVTGEDAAQTAIAYGAEMAALNTLLALAQQTVRMQSDCLWLEPDFTGTRLAERRISCTVSARAILMFHLLYRIWKDPLLQPASQR